MRYLDRSQIERFPGNGFLALEDTIKTRGNELSGLARAYAKGPIFTLNNPEAAVRIVYTRSSPRPSPPARTKPLRCART